MLKYILISFLIITNAYAYTCEEMGYTKTIADCPEGGLKCPAQPEKMFCCDPCGNKGGYRYTAQNCSPDDGLQLAGIECGGKWTECRQCTSEYKYSKDNCRSPKILAGIQCGNAYTGCVYPSGSGCVPTVGYIYYADGSCHADYDDTKTPIGIIVDAARKIIVALDEGYYPTWNDEGSFSIIDNLANYRTTDEALLDINGEENTDKISSFMQKSGRDVVFASYCINKTTGNKKWYVPSLGELYTLFNEITDIQSSVELLPIATDIDTSKGYWSSTPYQASNMWFIKGGNTDYNFYNNPARYTRCFSHF